MLTTDILFLYLFGPRVWLQLNFEATPHTRSQDCNSYMPCLLMQHWRYIWHPASLLSSQIAFILQICRGLSDCADTLKGEDKQTYTFMHESAHMRSGARRPLAFHQHESAFMFTAEQTEKAFTSCVYLEYASFHDCLPS